MNGIVPEVGERVIVSYEGTVTAINGTTITIESDVGFSQELNLDYPLVTGTRTSSPENMIEQMRERFGEDHVQEYLRLMKAMRGIMMIWMKYTSAQEGSAQEQAAKIVLAEMLDKMKSRPDHAVQMIEGLLALVEHLKSHGSYDSWFLGVGIDPSGPTKGPLP